MLLTGVLWTLGLTALAVVVGLTVAVAASWTRQDGPKWLAIPVGTYVELVRNTPFIVQLYFIFFGLPELGLRLDPPLASALAQVLNLGAYGTEIIRAGLSATPRGQIAAARSLALTEYQVFTRVVLPPALKNVWPALVGQIIILMLGSAVCGQIATRELSYAANVISANTFHTFESYIVATVIYLLLAMLVRRLLNWAGPRLIFGSEVKPQFTYWDILRNLLLAGQWTVVLSLIDFIGGGIVGMVWLALRVWRPETFGPPFGVYVQLFQGTPLLMQLFLSYFGLRLVGIEVSVWISASLALTLYTSAFLAEIWRGCVASIPRGQWEAGSSLALSFAEQMRHVIAHRPCASRSRPPSASWCRSSRAPRWPRSSASPS